MRPDVPSDSSCALGDADVRALLELAPDGIFVADLSGRYLYVNAAGARLLGRGKAEVVGLAITDLIRADEIPRLMQEREAMLQGRPHVSEWQLRRKDGTWVDVEITASILPSGMWQGFVRDISHRKAQEAEREALLRQAERRQAWLDAVIERLPVGVVLFQEGGGITFNRHVEETFGIALQAGAGAEQYANRIFHPDGRPVPLEEFPSIRARGGTPTPPAEYLIRRSDGQDVPVIATAGPILDGEGRLLGAVGVFQELTDALRLQRAVRENERLLDAVFELLPAGVAILDAGANLVRENRARQQMWRGAADAPAHGEHRGRWVATGVPLARDDWPGVRAVRRGETTSNALVELECFDGSTRTVIKYAAPLRDEQGRITGAVVVDEDVTELFGTQKKLQDSERLFRTVIDLLPVGVYIADAEGRITRGNPAGWRIWQGLRHVGPEGFHEYKAWWIDTGRPITPDDWGVTLAVVSHDLRNPLVGVRLLAAAMERDARNLPGAEDLRRCAANVREAAAGMSGLVDDLLAVSVAGSGHSLLKFTPVAPRLMVERAVELARPLCARAGLELLAEIPVDLPVMQVDVNRIQRVFANLLDNALKFSERGGRVVVRAEAEPGAVLFSVANSGPALGPEDMQRMFQPFWQAGREDGRGAGLGLSICRSIIEAHGGSIWTEAAEGMRVKVLFLLPSAIPTT